MIYKYQKIVSSGPYGTSVTHTASEDHHVTTLGTVDGFTYIHVEVLVDQPQELEFIEVSDEELQQVKPQLKSSSLVRVKKDQLRSKIESEVGDVHDLIADCMKLIEFNFVLTARLAASYFGTTVMTPEMTAEYAARNQYLLSKIDSGEIKLRSDFEDVNMLMSNLMERYSKIQELVESEYVDPLKKIGL